MADCSYGTSDAGIKKKLLSNHVSGFKNDNLEKTKATRVSNVDLNSESENVVDNDNNLKNTTTQSYVTDEMGSGVKLLNKDANQDENLKYKININNSLARFVYIH